MSANDDDFEERPTPPERPRPGFTDSQRDIMRDRLAVVSEYEEREVTAPIDLFERPVRPTEGDLIRALRRDPHQLAVFVAKIAARIHERERGDSDANRKALAEVKALLDRPPDGRLNEVRGAVEALGRSVAVLERSSLTADAGRKLIDLADDVRIKALEGDARFAKRAAQSMIVFLILTLGAAGYWLGVKIQQLSGLIDSVKDLEHKSTPFRWPQATKDNAP